MRRLGLSHLIILSADYPNNLVRIVTVQTAGNTRCTNDPESPPKEDEHPSQEHDQGAKSARRAQHTR